MNKAAPQVLLDYVEGLKNHDVDQIASTLAEDVQFISATRILGKKPCLGMLGALYSGFPDWDYKFDEIENRGQGNYAIKWHQGGTHTGVLAMPGMTPLQPTGKVVKIPPHYFFYRVSNDKLSIIFPEPVEGGAPRGILEQIGAEVPPL